MPGIPMESALVLAWVEELQGRILAVEQTQEAIDGLESRIRGIEEASAKIEKRLADIEHGMAYSYTRLDALDREVQRYDHISLHHVERLARRISKLEAETKESIEKLKASIEQPQ